MTDFSVAVIAGTQIENLIPVWFYIFSGLAYFAAAAISLAVCYFAFRIYRTTAQKKIMLLSVVFLILGFAFLSLTVSSIYTYFYLPFFKNFLGISLTLFNNNAFTLYYLLSLFSYILLFFTYFPEDSRKKLYLLYVPLWFSGVDGFHVASVILLAFVVYRAVYNFYKSKSTNTFLVLLAFSLMTVFHVTMLLLPFDVTYFLVSHSLLVVGFLSLLAMLIRVNKNGRSGKRRK